MPALCACSVSCFVFGLSVLSFFGNRMLYMLTALHSGRMPECRAVFKSVHIKKSGIYAASKVFYEESSKTYVKCVWHKRVVYMPQLMLFAWNSFKPATAVLNKKERYICRK